MPLISSLTRSASARAACSRSSASRSCWRRTPLGHVADEARDERLSLDLDLRDGRLGGEAAAVAAQELDVVALGRHDPRRFDEGPPALVVALAELGRRDQRAHRHAHGLGGGPAEEPLGRSVPGRDHPVAVQRDEGVRGAVEHQSRARLALLHRTGTALGVLHARPDPREQARDQQARHQRRADCEQPEHHGTRGLDQDQHDRVAHRDQGHVRERHVEPEEVEGEQGGPRVQQRVEDRRLDKVVRQRQDHRAGRERGVQLPRPHAVRPDPNRHGHRRGDRGQDDQLAVLDEVRVREREREQPERRTG